MTDREKLAKLIAGIRECPRFSMGCDGCMYIHDEDCFVTRTADYLLANGLTFAKDICVLNKWIPVSERLPEKNKKVLVYCENTTIQGGAVLHTGSCDNGFWFLATRPGTESFPFLDWKVTHWMELPNPPKKEDE